MLFGCSVVVQCEAGPQRARICVGAFGGEMGLPTILQYMCARVFVGCVVRLQQGSALHLRTCGFQAQQTAGVA